MRVTKKLIATMTVKEYQKAVQNPVFRKAVEKLYAPKR